MKIAVLGMGTVGSGFIQLIQKNYDLIEQRARGPLEITHVYSRSLNNRYGLDLTGIQQTKNIEDILNSDVDIVVEVMGGIDETYEIAKKVLTSGKHYVTANKDMLAIHVEELSRLANEHEVQFNYEASVGGGIPVVLGIQYGLNANRISRIIGILNGTTNYILTRMSEDDWDFEHALQQAQEKGYAEADPTNDIGGFDAQRKIALLSRLAFRQSVNLDDVFVRGIDKLELIDIQIAKDLGWTIKLLGLSEANGDQLDIMVAPTLIPSTAQLAKVNEAMNAILVNGDAIGETLFYGPGAGSMETASAVVADTMNIVNFGFIKNTVTPERAEVEHNQINRPYYLRVDNTVAEIHEKMPELIKHVLMDTDEHVVIQTNPINRDNFGPIQETFNVLAYYAMIEK